MFELKADGRRRRHAGAVWLITGIPGAGKTTLADLLARRFARGVHIESEQLQAWIVAGSVWPGDEPEEESERQLDLQTRNASLLGRSYAEAGFIVTIDNVIITRRRLDEYRTQLSDLDLSLVVLDPGQEIAAARDRDRAKSQEYVRRTGITIAERWAHLEEIMRAELRGCGLWITNAEQTPEEAVNLILQERQRALLPRP